MFSKREEEALAIVRAAIARTGHDPGILDNVTRHATVLHTSSQTSTSHSALLSLESRPTPASHVHAARALASRDLPTRTSTGVRINRITVADKYLEYPLGAILEYPGAALTNTGVIGHCFTVDPNDTDVDPADNMQYSLGGSHTTYENVHCGPLVDSNGQPVYCKKRMAECRGLKQCEFNPYGISDLEPVQRGHPSARAIIFSKTMAFACVVEETGCNFDSDLHIDHGCRLGSNSDDKDSSSFSRDRVINNRRCHGKMIMMYDSSSGEPFLQCEYRSLNDPAHLVLWNIQDFDIPYLAALISGNVADIKFHEENARLSGYGPLVPCSFVASPSEQKEYCPYWHRSRSSGKLCRGLLKSSASKCSVVFHIYIPYNLSQCPRVVLLSIGVHSHRAPSPVKTPPRIKDIFCGMLFKLGWKLADATPRKLMLESGFTNDLRAYLGWTSTSDPPLSELHPSLGNLDHVRRIINVYRKHYFPNGTGFEGAVRLASIHLSLPEDDQYVRCAETHILRDGTKFQLVICMSKAMAFSLLRAQYVTIDTSFKRVHGPWEEFEIEAWDAEGLMSTVGVHAFITSQTAEAHFKLFVQIYYFATTITGLPVQFHHIHGTGYKIWMADAHKGQALGVGMFCQWLCKDLGDCRCSLDKAYPRLSDLDPYDHLRRLYRCCVVHFKRNIEPLSHQVTKEVYKAMRSISSTTKKNLDKSIAIIKASNNSKARAWIRDKENAKFVIPALYWPASLIPLEFWQASPSSTNGNEQAHRSINRDGINLTMLGGIMRGMQYDFRVHSSRSLYLALGIHMRDQIPTDYRRQHKSVARHAITQQRAASRSPQKPPQKKNNKKPTEKPLPMLPLQSNSQVAAARQTNRNNRKPVPYPVRGKIIYDIENNPLL